MGKDVTIAGADGARFSAYIAEPQAAKAPGLVLLQYICGVNRVMRNIAEDFAARGFLVAVPDLFWRQEPNVQLVNDPTSPLPDEQKRAMALNAGFDDDKAILDIVSTIHWLRASARCSGKVGALGYCLGGRMAYFVATRTDADCSIGYYGVNIEKHLDEAKQIKKPLMLHIGGRDPLSSDEGRAAIEKVLGSNPLVKLYVYPEAGHAFVHLPGPNHRVDDAETANARSLALLKECLGAG